MDNSRDHDLRALHKRFNDHSIPLWKRNKAYRTFQNIQDQVKDKQLIELRHRLVKAAYNDDPDAVARIELQIKEHGRRKGYVEG